MDVVQKAQSPEQKPLSHHDQPPTTKNTFVKNSGVLMIPLPEICDL
jgi:hypothetical protein